MFEALYLWSCRGKHRQTLVIWSWLTVAAPLRHSYRSHGHSKYLITTCSLSSTDVTGNAPEPRGTGRSRGHWAENWPLVWAENTFIYDAKLSFSELLCLCAADQESFRSDNGSPLDHSNDTSHASSTGQFFVHPLPSCCFVSAMGGLTHASTRTRYNTWKCAQSSHFGDSVLYSYRRWD